MIELHAEVSTEAPFPKGLLIWNYNDHEHVVGTHYKNYETVEILAEADWWCFSRRTARLPFIPIRTSALAFSYYPNENLQRSYHSGPFGLLLRQEFHFEELGANKTRVTLHSALVVPRVFGFLQPFFQKLMYRWFWSVWEEDMAMRERRLKVWQLGFKDLVGLDYVNSKTAAPEAPDLERPYPLELPLPKVTKIALGGVSRPFRASEEVGYGLPDLPVGSDVPAVRGNS
jgi:hypothetical protein